MAEAKYHDVTVTDVTDGMNKDGSGVDLATLSTDILPGVGDTLYISVGSDDWTDPYVVVSVGWLVAPIRGVKGMESKDGDPEEFRWKHSWPCNLYVKRFDAKG